MTILVLNADTGGLSEYDITAVDVATGTDGGVRVATSAAVLHQAAGTEAVTAELRTGALTLGVAGRKVVPEARVTLAADGMTRFWVTAEVEGRSHEIGPYALAGRPAGAPVTQRLRLGRGVKADSLALRIEAEGGSVWRLLGLSFEVQALR
jgi:hypothetical protein